MADIDPAAVSDAQETSTEEESSSTDTQATEQEAEPQTTEQERTDWRRKQREDSELNAHVQSEIARARTRWQRQQLRAAAAAAVTSEDPQHARYVAQQVASEPDEPDDGDDSNPNGWTPEQIDRAARIQPQLEDILELNSEGRSTNPYYVALHQQIGEKGMNERYAKDPVAFVRWVRKETMRMEVADEVKKVAPAYARGQASDDSNTRLRETRVPLAGSGGGGSLTLESYERMGFAERQKLRKENPRAIDEMIARAAR